MFHSNIYNRKKQFHIYSTDDYALKAIGMSQYTISSLSNYMNPDNPDVKKFFSDSVGNNLKRLTGETTPTVEQLSILKWNKESLKYDLVQGNEIFLTEKGTSVATDIKDLLEKNDYLQYGDTGKLSPTTTEDLTEVINNIKTSYSGCITFIPTFTVLGDDRSPLIKLELLDRFHHDTSRKLAMAGPPVIAASPSTSDGMQYSLAGQQSTPIGVYPKPSEGGNTNPKNTVAAPLDIRYDPATATWQAGTHQVLARLLTDVDPVPLDNTAVSNIDGLTPSEAYDTNSPRYMGSFKTGEAIPLSIENGNPHMFGPNYRGCPENDTTTISKITVTNRSPRGFKKGDIVMCSNIGPEWIIQGFDTPTISTKKSTSIGKWSFQKFIVTSEGYLKDGRSVTYDPSVYPDAPNYDRNINPDIYESKMRLKYYMHLHGQNSDGTKQIESSPLSNLDSETRRKIALLNLYIDKDESEALKSLIPKVDEYDIKLSSFYSQSTVFDNLGIHMGGINSQNFIGRTNILEAPDTSIDITDVSQRNLPFFWGPLFPNGYSSPQVNKLKSSNQSFIPFPNDSIFLRGGTNKNIFDNSSALNALIDEKNNLFYNTNDSNAKQLPAEVALNASINSTSKNGFPIEYIDNFWASFDSNLVDIFYLGLKNPNRYHWLEKFETTTTTSTTTGPGTTTSTTLAPSFQSLYDLAPLNSNIIQFSPLQLHAALSSVFLKTDGRKYADLRRELTIAASMVGDGNLQFTKLRQLFGPGPFSSNGITRRPSYADIYKWEDDFIDTPIRFGELNIKQGPAPLGGPEIIPKNPNDGLERSNIIGIIAAKNKFTAPSNGSIKFVVKQTTGLSDKITVSPGESFSISTIGGFIFGGGTGGVSATRGVPRWGDNTGTERSFGTTALHVRIFDQWPDKQTFYDGRYFSVLHFNPFVENDNAYSLKNSNGVSYKVVNAGKFYTEDWDYTKTNVVYQRNIDIQETSVDFRVPTYMHPKDTSIDNTLVPLDTIIEGGGANVNGTIKPLRPPSEWRIDPIRRGQLLTNGGFRYYKTVIGANELQVINGGENYAIGDVITFPNGATGKVAEIQDNGKISKATIIERGYGFLPPNFRNIGVPATNIESANGQGAAVCIKNGKVYHKLEHDLGPELKTPITRLTLPSTLDRKSAITDEMNTVSVDLEGNGKYDAFYLFHNDVLHTIWENTYSYGPPQYVNLEITTG